MTELQKEEIYVNYKSKVEGYISARISDKHDVEDVVSSVFVKVYHNIDDFDSKKASFSTWIYSITKNTVIDYFRTRKEYCQLDIDKLADYSFSEFVDAELALTELAEALSRLEVRQRDLIILHYYDGKTLKEVAAVFGVSYIYIKVLHKKTLQTLKKLLSW